MPITLYRRHGADCVTRNPSSPEYRLDHNAKRLYRNCGCPIWVTGTLNGREIDRQSCRTRNWDEAERLRAGFERPVPAAAPPVADRGPRLEHCITQYLERREDEIANGTRYQYKLVLRWLADFARARHVEYVRGLTVGLLEDFKHAGLPRKLLASGSRCTYMNKVVAFVRECERVGWIEARLADRILPVHVDQEPTMPFEDVEIDKILACDMPPIYRLVIRFMLETGVRVSDAVDFDPARLIRGRALWIYPYRMIKRRRKAKVKYYDVFVTDDLRSAIELVRGEWMSPTLPFRAPGGARETATRRVYREMQRVGERIGVEDCRPHRLRDTFALRKLLAGFSFDDVSKLLGHSSVAITEKAYAPWVPSRARRLEAVVAASLAGPLGQKLLGDGSGDAH